MAKTLRIQELLSILAERAWTHEEFEEVKMITGDDDRGPRPFEIEGDWGDPGVKKYDGPDVEIGRTGPNETSPVFGAIASEESAQDARLARMSAPPTSRQLQDLPGGTPVEMVWGIPPQDRKPPSGDAHDHEVRLRQLEAVAHDLLAKLKALEDRLGVGK